MTDQPRSDDPTPGGPTPPPDDTPWWSRPSGQAWDAPPEAPGPAEALADTTTYSATTPPTYADTTRNVWSPPEAPGDTLGGGDGTGRPGRGALFLGALLLALVAGGTGGGVGYLLADHNGSSVTIDGANLGAAPARSVQRPEGSVAGVAAKVLPSVVQIKVNTSEGQATGSGFVIDEAGLLVTNNHVVSGAQGKVRVSFVDGTTATAKVVGTSPSYDLAVLKINAKNLSALPLGNSESIVVGDPVIAIGSPLGLSGTVTTGIVSAKNRPVTAGERGRSESSYINAIQTDAAINPGNSGGPLVDLDGEVIGVNSAIATLGTAGLGGESGNIGVGFAIPINQARLTIEQLINKGEAQFPIIGASLDGPCGGGDTSNCFDGPGARIATGSASNGTPPLVDEGPAQKAGLKPGDVITAVNGGKVADSAELIVAIRAHRPGETITLTVKRGGNERKVSVTLGAKKG
jgi:putative serine protease PepD